MSRSDYQAVTMRGKSLFESLALAATQANDRHERHKMQVTGILLDEVPMPELHICCEPLQPATRCIDNHSAEPRDISYAPDDMLWVSCCHRVRPASDCVIQCRYDGSIIWCAPGHGCQDPQVVAAKRTRIFANRSAGQKARWARQKNPPES